MKTTTTTACLLSAALLAACASTGPRVPTAAEELDALRAAVAPRWPVPVDVAPVDESGPPRPGSAGVADRYYPSHGNGGLDVLSYDLGLVVDPVAGSLDGDAELTIRALHALTSFHLELWELEVTRARVDGLDALVRRDGGEIEITPPAPIEAGAEFVVEISYGGTPRGVPSPSVPFDVGIGWMRSDDSVYVMSQPNGASSFFPCNDTPLDKALYTFRITAPRGNVAVANGRLVSSETHPAGRLTVWRASDPMASYLATIAVGPFEELLQEGPDGLPIRHYFHPSVEAVDRAAFRRAPEMIAFLEERFGPYPFESFGSIVSDADIPAALETQTMPTYGAGATGEGVVVHELAHQWFGNSVNVRDWSQLWISEGFASYATWLWTEHVRGREALDARAAASYGFLRERGVGAPADPGIDDLFGAEVYVRGPWVLHALRLEVGDEAFFETLRTFHERHDDGHAVIDDFVRTAVDVNGPEAGELLDAWLYDEQVPTVALYEPPPAGAVIE